MRELSPHQPGPAKGPLLCLQHHLAHQAAGWCAPSPAGGITPHLLPAQAVVRHPDPARRGDPSLGVVKAQRRVGKGPAERLQPFHQALEEGLKAKVLRFDQVAGLDEAGGSEEAQGQAPAVLKGPGLAAYLVVGYGDVGHLDHLLAGAKDGPALARQGVLRPHFTHGQPAAPPAAGRLLHLAPDASPLELAHRQDDIGEELQGLGVEGQAELHPFPRFIAEEGPAILLHGMAAAGEGRLDGVGTGDIPSPLTLGPHGADQEGDRAGGGQGAGGALPGLPVHAEAGQEGVVERAADGRPLMLIQFDGRLHFGHEAQAMGGEAIHSRQPIATGIYSLRLMV